MNDFEFHSPTRFVFGRESEKKTGELVRSAKQMSRPFSLPATEGD